MVQIHGDTVKEMTEVDGLHLCGEEMEICKAVKALNR